MKKPTILITGAAGKTGAAATIQLLEKGFPVRAFVRRCDARSNWLKSLGAEVVVGSLEDMRDLRAALTGVRRAYFCPPLEPGALRRATLFAAAAQEANLESLVVLSQWAAAARHPAIHSREKWLSERMFGWAPGLNVTSLNPGFFADNYMAALEAIAHFGLMAMPLGRGSNAPPSNEDIARVAVAVLTNPDAHIGKTYRPTGPTLLWPDDIAAAMQAALGRRVKYQDAPISLFLTVAKSLGVSEFVIEELFWFLKDYQSNAFGLGSPTGVVADVAGVDPEPFEAIARRYIARSGFAKRTLRTRFAAVHNLLAGLATRTPAPSKIAEKLHLPALREAWLAVESEEWREAHLGQQ